MSAGSLKTLSALHAGSRLPYVVDVNGAIVTPGNYLVDGEYFCPACSKPAVFDGSLGCIGEFRHARRGTCSLDDDASERYRRAVLRLKGYLESLGNGEETDGRNNWPWVTHVCACRLEGLRDLKGRFTGFRMGDTAASEPEFYLTDKKDGEQETIVMSLFVRSGTEALKDLHQNYSRRFIAIDPERAMRTPSVWRLESVEGVANYRGVSAPPCPVCGPAETGNKKTA